MPPLNLPGVKILGRPFKPVAFGFVLSMLVFWWAGLSDQGVLDGTFWGDAVGWVGLGVAGVLLLAWWKRSQHLAERGLFAVFLLTFWYSLTVVLVTGTVALSALLSFCMSLIAAGSWLLEKADPNPPLER